MPPAPAPGYRDIEPYAEVGGLDAALAGSLAELVEALLAWRELLDASLRPAEWGERARALLARFFRAADDHDRVVLNQLEEALQCWLEICENALFDEPVPLAVMREAWMTELDQPALTHQFVSGGVTFCTLMPMRAVPFRVVCLLGMNDGDFPRRAQQSDFDLLALPGMARPGDRSRRDDDRYLMLEALLAARDKFYVSWVGRNVRDNSEQPPSVLVAQLRDYLVSGWNLDLDGRTTVHALQPFSRRYFEEGGLLTYAGEWRSAHGADEAPEDAAEPLPPYELDPDYRLKLGELASFLRQPARYFFRRRLGVSFDGFDAVGEDEEPFSLNALERFQVESTACCATAANPRKTGEVRAVLDERAGRLLREGVLPIGGVGKRLQRALVEELVPARRAWLALRARYPQPAAKFAVTLDLGGIVLDDWIDHLRSDGAQTVWMQQTTSKIVDKQGKKGALRADKLVDAWLCQLAACAAGTPVTGYLVARDAVVEIAPIDCDSACARLAELVALWRANLDQPLPVAARTALAFLRDGKAESVRRQRAAERRRSAARGRGTGAGAPVARLRCAGGAAGLAGRGRAAVPAAGGMGAGQRQRSAVRGRRGMSELLRPLTFPLHGSRLIEASAGTGKTWTIAALYLRLVLGDGGPDAFAAPAAARDPGDDLYPRRHARAVEPRARTPGAGGAPLPRRGCRRRSLPRGAGRRLRRRG
jgi:exodeoxyribonuclease V gamma subunit